MKRMVQLVTGELIEIEIICFWTFYSKIFMGKDDVSLMKRIWITQLNGK